MNKILHKVFLSILLAVTIIAPRVALADECADLKEKFNNASSTLSQDINTLPEYCSVEAVYTKVINIALYAIGIVSVIMIIYGGYIYITAGANEESRKRGRTILIWAIIGLVLVLAAAMLVNTVVTFVVEN